MHGRPRANRSATLHERADPRHSRIALPAFPARAVADAVETGFAAVGSKRIDADVALPAETASHLATVHGAALREFDRAVDTFRERDCRAARAVLGSKEAFNASVDDTRIGLVAPVASAKGPPALTEYRLAIDLVDGINHIHTLARRIARAVVEARRRDG